MCVPNAEWGRNGGVVAASVNIEHTTIIPIANSHFTAQYHDESVSLIDSVRVNLQNKKTKHLAENLRLMQHLCGVSRGYLSAAIIRKHQNCVALLTNTGRNQSAYDRSRSEVCGSTLAGYYLQRCKLQLRWSGGIYYKTTATMKNSKCNYLIRSTKVDVCVWNRLLRCVSHNVAHRRNTQITQLTQKTKIKFIYCRFVQFARHICDVMVMEGVRWCSSNICRARPKKTFRVYVQLVYPGTNNIHGTRIWRSQTLDTAKLGPQQTDSALIGVCGAPFLW